MPDRVEIKEIDVLPRCLPWTMKLRKVENSCDVFIVGGQGGKKAALSVSFADLANAVDELKKD